MGDVSRAGLWLVLASLAVPPLSGQQASRPNPPFTMWLSVAPLSPGKAIGAAALVAQYRWLVLGGRLALWDDPCTSSDCWPNGDIGVLAGYGAKAGGRWHVYGAAGLSSGFDDNSGFLAIPLQAEVTWRPLKFIGVGVMGFASIGVGKADQFMRQAESRSFGGVSLAIQLGKVR
jgi:hypothetical protein